MGFRQLRQQKMLIDQERAAAAASMANELAHKINNPLQSITNVVYLASQNASAPEAKALAAELDGDVGRLSGLVKKLLALPFEPAGKESL